MFFFFIKNPLPRVEYPEQVCHYTNADAFLGIIKNKELWASHILFQNDKKEALYSLDLLSESLYENKAAFAKNNIDIQKLLSYIKPLTGQQIFTISFSEKRDDLNQWRSYGNSNPSYCIGFDPKQLEKLKLKQSYNSNYEDKVRVCFSKCIYTPNQQKEIIKNIIKDVIEKLKASKMTEESIADELLPDFLTISPFFKHPSFEEEQEWRLVFSSVEKESVNIRYTKSGFVPYITLPITVDSIKDIIISPCPDSVYMLNSTKYVCSQYGIEPVENKVHKIENSTIPYRN